MLKKLTVLSILVLSSGISMLVHADDAPAVGFDRPGIGFSTNIMPEDSVAWEQGLPDFSYSKDKSGGQSIKTTIYQADTLIRTGLAPHVELQLGWAGPTWSKVSGAGVSDKSSGYADTSIGLKAALPLSSQQWSLAFLGASTLNTGDADFGADKRTISFGSTANYDINDKYSAALYANVDRYYGSNTWTVSPSVAASLTDSMGSFVEYGYSKTKGESQQSVLGGGLTWMIYPRVQLDVSADFGLNNSAPDIQGGFGISVMTP